MALKKRAAPSENRGDRTQEIRPRHSTVEMSNDHGGKGVAERSK